MHQICFRNMVLGLVFFFLNPILMLILYDFVIYQNWVFLYESRYFYDACFEGFIFYIKAI